MRGIYEMKDNPTHSNYSTPKEETYSELYEFKIPRKGFRI